MISNSVFISAIFGDSAPNCHVTDFMYDPGAIPDSEHLRSWAGGYFSNYRFTEGSNQYFTVSTFAPDDAGKARRRKALFLKTHCIVLDDVREKLDVEAAKKLPPPSWVLETSPGSEQWGYILNEPATERAHVENLLDGLVAKGLAPDGKDPGMKGVTRYVRLPDGYNRKASKMVNGQPFKCRMLVWQPHVKTTLEAMAAVFNIDLYAQRRESRVDGASAVSDHPLLQIPDIIHIKEVRSDGRYDITCPWVAEHTGAVDNGAAIFTNADLTMGFKCHHGACQHRTGGDLLNLIDSQVPGFKHQLSMYQVTKSMSSIMSTMMPSVAQVPVVPAPPVANVAQTPVVPAPPVATDQQPQQSMDDVLNAALSSIRVALPGSSDAAIQAEAFLKSVEKLPEIMRQSWHDRVRDLMNWDKRQLRTILQDCRKRWRDAETVDDDAPDFFGDVIFVNEQNQFFNPTKRIWYSVEAYQNVYGHLDPEARKNALQGNRVVKVDRVDYAPKQPAVFVEDGIVYGNTWSAGNKIFGFDGDATPWLRHFDTLGWSNYRDHILKWMAFTLRHPDIKINHMLLLGSAEGSGKDWLLYPLMRAMGDDYTMINAEELLEPFNDYLMSTKYLHINEAELGERNEAVAVSSKLKPLAAAPPERLRVNEKFAKKISVRNIVSVSMTTNKQIPITLSGDSRRILALWSNIKTRDSRGTMLPKWAKFWTEHWEWMKNGGAEVCIHYLYNKVDLSDFNPGLPPPVTDYLRSIVAAGRPYILQVLDAAIQSNLLGKGTDMLTTDEILQGIRSLSITNPEMGYNGNLPSQSRMAQYMRESGYHGVEVDMGEGFTKTAWVIRNVERFENLPDDQLAMHYLSTRSKSMFDNVTSITRK